MCRLSLKVPSASYVTSARVGCPCGAFVVQLRSWVTPGPTPRLEGPLFASGLVDGGLAVNLTSGQPSDFILHSAWSYSAAGLYQLPWDVSVSGTVYGRQGNPIAEAPRRTRPDGLGVTRVVLDRDLDARRYPSVHMLDL